MTGNAYDQPLDRLPQSWSAAIDTFADSAPIKRVFAPTLIGNLLATKRQELRYMAELTDEEQTELYLDTV